MLTADAAWDLLGRRPLWPFAGSTDDETGQDFFRIDCYLFAWVIGGLIAAGALPWSPLGLVALVFFSGVRVDLVLKRKAEAS